MKQFVLKSIFIILTALLFAGLANLATPPALAKSGDENPWDPKQEITNEEKKIIGIWHSLPMNKNSKYKGGGGEVDLHYFEGGTGYFNILDYQPHFESIIYDPESGEYVIKMMTDTVKGNPNFHTGPQKVKLTEMITHSLDFYEVVGRMRYIPGKPERLAIKLRIPSSREFDNYLNVEYELVRAEYVETLGAAKYKNATPGSVKEEFTQRHWLTGEWKTRTGDGMIYNLDHSGKASSITPTDEKSGDYEFTGNDRMTFDLLWDDVEKAWAMASLLGGRTLSISKVYGYIRPSSGEKDVVSETLEVEFEYAFTKDFKWRPRAILEKIPETSGESEPVKTEGEVNKNADKSPAKTSEVAPVALDPAKTGGEMKTDADAWPANATETTSIAEVLKENPVQEAGGSAPEGGVKLKMYPADIKGLNTFLSNFTEQSFTQFDTAPDGDDELIHLGGADSYPDLIRFGILHNYINNFNSRVTRCETKTCEWGPYQIDGKYVVESVKKYFDLNLKNASVTDSDPPYYFDGKFYHFNEWDDGDTYYADAKEIVEEGGEVLRIKGEIYNKKNGKDRPAMFEATVKPFKFGGKDTWAILSFKTDWK